MRLDDYQDSAANFCLPQSQNVTYLTLGLVGEAGEVAEKVKKWMRDGTELDEDALAREVGDVLWYISNLSLQIGFTLEEIAEINLKKLGSRKNRGKIGGSGDDR